MTCYICLEECNTESPCQCRAKVHIKCLMDYTIATQTTECSICKQNMEQLETLALLISMQDVGPVERKVNMAMCTCLTLFLMTALFLTYMYAKITLNESIVMSDVAVVGFIFLPTSAFFAACMSLEKVEEDS